MKYLSLFLVLLVTGAGPLDAGEVLIGSSTKVVVRKHAKTGRPYVVIADADAPIDSNVEQEISPAARPDYRMLDAKARPSDFSYEGPVSDRTKVYVFAGTMAALGVAGGVAGVLVPAASSGGAAGGAGLFAGGAALTSMGTAELVIKLHEDPSPEDYESLSISKAY